MSQALLLNTHPLILYKNLLAGILYDLFSLGISSSTKLTVSNFLDVNGLSRHRTWTCRTPYYAALLLHAMASPGYEKEKQEKYELLKFRYETVKRVLRENEERYSDAFLPLPFNSGYFMCLRLKAGLESEPIRRKLLDDYGTGVIALGPILRFTFSSVSVKDIPEAFENIYRACKG